MQTENISKTEFVLQTAYLIPFADTKGDSIPVQDFFSIGRDAQNVCVLNDSFVSSRHARIEKRNNAYVLRDLQSRNGTFLNSSKILEAQLKPNDHIVIGKSEYIFSEAPSTALRLKSKNDAWNQQLDRAPAFASTKFAVLLTGPSGSGKDVLAKYIHQNSAHKTGPFISINCGALTESLIESELFGHKRGSFTGATDDRRGAFESARNGTLFLDEIGDLPLSLQPKLLRALENHEIRPVGADKNIKTNVRIIAATHKNLFSKVQSGQFREDLFYRLNVCHLQVPSLQKRMEDFEEILYSFAKEYKVRFSFHAIEKLKEYSWPGNIRELRNVVSRAAAYFPKTQIMPEHISELIGQDLHMPRFSNEIEFQTKNPVIKEIEREIIIKHLVYNKGNQRKTASALNLPKSTLNDRIRSYNINIEQILNGQI